MTDPAYRALRESAIVVEPLERSLGVFYGPKAPEVLNGLVSNEIAALAAGCGAYAVALTPKGKIIADLRVLRLQDDVLVDVTAAASDGWWAMVRKYVNPRLSRFEDLSSTMSAVGLFGPAAARLVEAASGERVDSLAIYAHRPLRIASLASRSRSCAFLTPACRGLCRTVRAGNVPPCGTRCWRPEPLRASNRR